MKENNLNDSKDLNQFDDEIDLFSIKNIPKK